MDKHDATEVAYKNGYTQGKIDATEHIQARLEELYDDISYNLIYSKSVEYILQRLKNILNDIERRKR